MASYLKKIWNGQTMMRILMDEGFRDFSLRGKVADIGGGRNPDYFNYFKKENVSLVEPIDASISKIDFEKDKLPFGDNSLDTVVCANVLEHIYNHNFLVGEMRRILKSGGTLVGFVPFFIQYHPDPKDYFRYTHEALEKILSNAGFKQVKVHMISKGPFTTAFNSMMLSFPKPIRVIGVYSSLLLDSISARVQPNVKERYPLGYIFTGTK